MFRTALQVVSLAAALAATHSVQAAAAALWKQVSQDSYVGLNSQNFGESSFDQYDNQGADDFVVPEGETWMIRTIEARGTHYGGSGPLDSMNVVIYRSKGHPGKPGEVVHELSALPAQGIGVGVDYTVPLPKPIKLQPGHYWLSLQGNMFFSEGGQWGWETTRSLTGAHAVWKNPGDGFRTGCTHYRRLRPCFGALEHGPDFMFVLYGKRKPSP